jgi:prepilin-type N-terminal cleavage/methylation domain-containing protein
MKNRQGFTLIEAMVSLVILGFALVGVQALITDRLVSEVGKHDLRATADQLVADRLHAVQASADYASLSRDFAGTEDPVPGHHGFQRTTFVAVGSGVTTVTVRVVTPERRDTVSRTRAVGAP